MLKNLSIYLSIYGGLSAEDFVIYQLATHAAIRDFHVANRPSSQRLEARS